VITNVNTGIASSLTTNEQGLYKAVNLVPGTYNVQLNAKGFTPVERTGLVLEVGAVAVLDIQVHVSGRNEKVEVQDAEPAVELTTSSISGVVDSHTVRELPLRWKGATGLWHPDDHRWWTTAAE
jgi:hypothetical protein